MINVIDRENKKDECELDYGTDAMDDDDDDEEEEDDDESSEGLSI